MDKIPSFLKDHDKLAPGFWFSGTANGVTTFDLRFKKPNCGDFISPAASHSVEHILATLLRNGSQKQNIVYFGPMGCRTGFYLLTVNIDENQAKKALIEALEQAEKIEEIPGAERTECGNYLDHDLEGAKEECRKYLELIND